MAKNDFISRQNQKDRNCITFCENFGFQRCIDMMQLALRDKRFCSDKFGRQRLEKLISGIAYYNDSYIDAYYQNPESDVKQNHMDEALREIWGEDLVPFPERYDYISQYNYNVAHRQKRSQNKKHKVPKKPKHKGGK